MRRAILLLCILLLLPGTSRADGDSDLLGRKLEGEVKRAVSEAGHSVACILVSRSDAYAKAPYWGVAHKAAFPGQLGKFDAAAATGRVPADVRHRGRILQQIADYDLSDLKTAPESYGSGLVVDGSGLILTSAHVVRHATKIFVRLGKARGSWADIHALDSYSDLAVLKLLDPPADLKALTLGDGAKVRKGQFILTLANEWTPRSPTGELVVRTGIVSALRQTPPEKTSERKVGRGDRDRRKLTIHHNETLIQINADGAPGCSGGAMVDLQGKVIGLTTALAGIASERGGFVIPFDTNTHRIIDVLKRGEEVEYGFLGVTLQRVDGGSAYLQDVIAGMPAARGGLKPGDQIVRINNHEVTKPVDLFLYIAMGLAGTNIPIEVNRGGARRTFWVQLAKFDVHKQVIASKQPPARFGLRVDYTSILSQRDPFIARWPQRAIPQGVIIREVVPDSPADQARLQPDKVITAVNGRAVHTPAQFYKAMEQAGDSVELTYLNSQRRAVHLTLHNK
jgi:serine protease Do